MNINVTFHIHVRQWQSTKLFKMLVEHYYSSVQVERFRIKGKGDREVLLEKRLNVHKQQWKIIKGEIDTNDIQQSAMALRDTQDRIDDYLTLTKNYPRKDGYISLEELRKEWDKTIKKWK